MLGGLLLFLRLPTNLWACLLLSRGKVPSQESTQKQKEIEGVQQKISWDKQGAGHHFQMYRVPVSGEAIVRKNNNAFFF